MLTCKIDKKNNNELNITLQKGEKLNIEFQNNQFIIQFQHNDEGLQNTYKENLKDRLFNFQEFINSTRLDQNVKSQKYLSLFTLKSNDDLETLLKLINVYELLTEEDIKLILESVPAIKSELSEIEALNEKLRNENSELHQKIKSLKKSSFNKSPVVENETLRKQIYDSMLGINDILTNNNNSTENKTNNKLSDNIKNTISSENDRLIDQLDPKKQNEALKKENEMLKKQYEDYSYPDFTASASISHNNMFHVPEVHKKQDETTDQKKESNNTSLPKHSKK